MSYTWTLNWYGSGIEWWRTFRGGRRAESHVLIRPKRQIMFKIDRFILERERERERERVRPRERERERERREGE